MQDRSNDEHAAEAHGAQGRGEDAAAPCSMPFPRDHDAIAALLGGIAADGVALCLCDADDRLRYVNATFRASFCPSYDGEPRAFVEVISAAIRDGTGITLTTTDLDAFREGVAARRRHQRGALSFATDTADGRWWWVTDTKLPSGWMWVTCQDISSLKHTEFALRDAHASALMEAQTDDLTGAPNRRHGFRSAEEAVAAAREDGCGLTVALIDIDHFKGINDRHGHAAGDSALRHLARVIASAVGPDDRFCRLGGDEFLVVSRLGDPAALERRLGDTFAAMPALVLPGLPERLRLSFSVGIARLEAGEAWPDLLRRADGALYAAKAAGRGCIAKAA